VPASPLRLAQQAFPFFETMFSQHMKPNLCTTYSAQVIAHIKECLLSGALRPGEPVREAAIAEKLGISRGPVREAVQALALEGLVSNLPQKAKYIRRMSAKEIEDSYCMGGTLEGACIVRSLPFMDDAAMRELRERFRQIEEQCRHASGLSALSDVDDAFHNALMSRCDNKLMVDTARKSCWHISKFLYYKIWDKIFTPAEFLKRHLLILEAVESRDAQRIETVLREHYAESGRRFGAVVAADDAAAMSRGKKGATSRQRQKRSDVYSEETA